MAKMHKRGRQPVYEHQSAQRPHSHVQVRQRHQLRSQARHAGLGRSLVAPAANLSIFGLLLGTRHLALTGALPKRCSQRAGR
ncbi:hypothetical protein AB0H63_28495 [Micromonospora echinospora]|uniref:hypothetical protein n=1 Tax=Micromonospora echinospora TaxID=1877 RepID=UPI003405E129